MPQQPDVADVTRTDCDTTTRNAARGLVCAKCGHRRLKVVYTRPAPNGRVVRRRECKRCGERFTTWERAIGQGPDVE